MDTTSQGIRTSAIQYSSVPEVCADQLPSHSLEKLFSYGTLQMESVQKETFGRELNGIKDSLIGYVLSEVKIKDPAVSKIV